MIGWSQKLSDMLLVQNSSQYKLRLEDNFEGNFNKSKTLFKAFTSSACVGESCK